MQLTQPTIVWVTTHLAQKDWCNKTAILSFVDDGMVNPDLNKLSFMSIT